MNNDKPYLPKVRTCYHPTEGEIKSYSESGDSTTLPNPAVDDIVVNNIAWQEFDYTECMADSDESILPEESHNYAHEINLASHAKNNNK